MAIEIVSFPIKNGDFHSYVSLPEDTWLVVSTYQPLWKNHGLSNSWDHDIPNIYPI